MQVATPSRERVEHYGRLRENVEREVGRINGEFGRVGAPAVHYLHQSYSRSELAALYRAADVMAVTPLRDGMNLVAKEYVAARTDLGGALVLSEFAGAARELRAGVHVQPARHQQHQGRPHARASRPTGARRRSGCTPCAGTCATTVCGSGPLTSSAHSVAPRCTDQLGPACRARRPADRPEGSVA